MEIKVAFPSYSKTYHCNYQPTEWFLPKLCSDYVISQKNRWYGGTSPHFKFFASWSMTWVPCCLAARTMLVLSYGKPVQPEPLEELIRTAGNTTRIQLRNATWDQGEDRPTVDGSLVPLTLQYTSYVQHEHYAVEVQVKVHDPKDVQTI